VLMYEMLLGQSPFRGDDEDEIFDAILEDEPLYPITMPRDAVSILQKVRFHLLWTLRLLLSVDYLQLLTRDPNRRLGSGKGDAEEIKRQPFFKDVVWDDVFNKQFPGRKYRVLSCRIISASARKLISLLSCHSHTSVTSPHHRCSVLVRARFE
jgi:serine/threonine protein kinase